MTAIRISSKDAHLFGIPGTPPRKSRTRKAKASKSGPSEATIQAQVENFLDSEKTVFIHVPDSLWRFIFAKELPAILRARAPGLCGALWKARKDASKYLLGLPDVVVLAKDRPALCVELKSWAGTVRKAQSDWAERFPVPCCRSIGEFVLAHDDWRMS